MTAIILSRGKVSPYRTERVPKKAAADTAEQNPGRLCWGDAGEMPPLVPVGIGFNVVPDEEHIEIKRETEPVKIYSDDGSMSVDADRTKKLLFEKKNYDEDTASSNTSTGGEDFTDFVSEEIVSFSPKNDGTPPQPKMIRVIFKNEGNSL